MERAQPFRVTMELPDAVSISGLEEMLAMVPGPLAGGMLTLLLRGWEVKLIDDRGRSGEEGLYLWLMAEERPELVVADIRSAGSRERSLALLSSLEVWTSTDYPHPDDEPVLKRWGVVPFGVRWRRATEEFARTHPGRMTFDPAEMYRFYEEGGYAEEEIEWSLQDNPDALDSHYGNADWHEVVYGQGMLFVRDQSREEVQASVQEFMGQIEQAAERRRQNRQ